MRSPIITGSSSIAFAIGGYAMPIVFPEADPAVAKALLIFAALLLVVSVVAWLWPIFRGRQTSTISTDRAINELVISLRNFAKNLRECSAARPQWESDSDVLGHFPSKVSKLDVTLRSFGVILAPGYFSESPEDVADRFEAIALALERGDREAAIAAAQGD